MSQVIDGKHTSCFAAGFVKRFSCSFARKSLPLGIRVLLAVCADAKVAKTRIDVKTFIVQRWNDEYAMSEVK